MLHPDYGNELHIIYSIFETNDEKRTGIGAGFFRGEFLSFSLGALLLGYIPLDGKPDYEVHPIWSGGYPAGNTAYIFGDKGTIKMENEHISVTLETKNYSLFLMMNRPLQYKCEFRFQSSNAEDTLFIPYFQSEGKLKAHGNELILKGFSFFWNLWGRNRLKLNDHAVFCVEDQCGFIQFDLKKNSAKILICPEKEEMESDFKITKFSKGEATEKFYPSEIELKKGGIRIIVSSMKNEAKLLTLSYLISLIYVEKSSKRGSGFIFFHPVEGKKKWEF
jgi:hypothetical protein